jgi:predicted ribosome quality control (RQC) complex YloA/Tae2 family protein
MSTSPSDNLALLRSAVVGRRIAAVRPLLPGCVAIVFSEHERDVPQQNDDGTLLVSIRAGAAALAFLEAGRRADTLIPDDVAPLARGEALRSREQRAEYAALRTAIEGSRVTDLAEQRPQDRVVVLSLANGEQLQAFIEVFARGGRIVVVGTSARTIRVALDAPGGSRAPLAIGSAYESPRRAAHAAGEATDGSHARSGDSPCAARQIVADPRALLRAVAESIRAEALREASASAARVAKKLRQRRAAIEAALAVCAEAPALRRRAETLLAHLGRVRKGAASARLPDVYGEGDVEIALDMSISPRENAERLFRRARKAERAEPVERARRAEVDALFAQIENARAKLAALSAASATLGEIAEAMETVRRVAKRAGISEQQLPFAGPRGAGASEQAGSRSAPGASAGAQSGARTSAGSARGRVTRGTRFAPRRFRTSEGWEVLVGRSNEENDYLTHRMARPDDLWFHVHGAAGSHVVLRRAGRASNPSRRTIEETASIAVYYSKAQHASRAPVIYTEARYVRKPRKSPPGLATCTREKMVMAPPREPRPEQRIVESEDGAPLPAPSLPHGDRKSAR